MHTRWWRTFAVAVALALAAAPAIPVRPAEAAGDEPERTWILVQPQAPRATGDAAVAGAAAAPAQRATRAGFTIKRDLRTGVWIVRGTARHAAALRTAAPGLLLAPDLPLALPPPELQRAEAPPAAAGGASGCASAEAACPLQWDLSRDYLNVPDAWRVTRGAAAVKVAVLDTGVTSTHEAVGTNYDLAASRSFVEYVSDQTCAADRDTWRSVEDHNGHGTWVATHIAGRNGTRMTGIAPETTLLNVRVLGACGVGFQSWILTGMQYAGEAGAQVVNMSLGGYRCADGRVPGSVYCDTPDAEFGPAFWNAYANMVESLRAGGTLVVAAAGNDHVQLDARGRVVNNGSLYSTGAAGACPVEARGHPCKDFRGRTAVPAGVPGAVAVAATNRVTRTGAPNETRHGQYGRGRRDQLAYYSSYGERIDVSAPGGARAYNVPNFDCLSLACGRLGESAAGEADNPGAFGAWGADTDGRPCATCYAFAQGTSMAAPQVAGTAALVLAAQPDLRPAQLAERLKRSVRPFFDYNSTPAVATDPASPWYRYDVDYAGPGISPRLLGAGEIDAAQAVGAPRATPMAPATSTPAATPTAAPTRTATVRPGASATPLPTPAPPTPPIINQPVDRVPMVVD